MGFSQQTIDIVKAIKYVLPEFAELDNLSISIHKDIQTGKEYILLQVKE